MTEQPEHETALDVRQRARIEALEAARRVLGSKAAFSSSAVDAIDVVNVARYIITGEDPWGESA